MFTIFFIYHFFQFFQVLVLSGGCASLVCSWRDWEVLLFLLILSISCTDSWKQILWFGVRSLFKWLDSDIFLLENCRSEIEFLLLFGQNLTNGLLDILRGEASAWRPRLKPLNGINIGGSRWVCIRTVYNFLLSWYAFLSCCLSLSVNFEGC